MTHLLSPEDPVLRRSRHEYLRQRADAAATWLCVDAHAFLDAAVGSSAASVPDRTWAHLADCNDCTETLDGLALVTAPTPYAGPRRRRVLVGLAAAVLAGIAGVCVGVTHSGEPTAPTAVVAVPGGQSTTLPADEVRPRAPVVPAPTAAAKAQSVTTTAAASRDTVKASEPVAVPVRPTSSTPSATTPGPTAGPTTAPTSAPTGTPTLTVPPTPTASPTKCNALQVRPRCHDWLPPVPPVSG